MVQTTSGNRRAPWKEQVMDIRERSAWSPLIAPRLAWRYMHHGVRWEPVRAAVMFCFLDQLQVKGIWRFLEAAPTNTVVDEHRNLLGLADAAPNRCVEAGDPCSLDGALSQEVAAM